MFSDHLLAYDLESIVETRKLAIWHSFLGAESYRQTCESSRASRLSRHEWFQVEVN